MKTIHWLTLGSALALGACQQTGQTQTAAAVTAPAAAPLPTANTETSQRAVAERVEAHMLFLADDALAGRDTGSSGHLIASQYIASNFKQLGLTPAGTQGYLQPVPMKQSKLVQSSPKLSLTVDGQATDFAFPKQFMTGPSSHEGKVDVSAGLVFVGYGLVSKEFGIDDYAGLDVKGKVVVMLPGRPESLPSEEAAHISSLKARTAAEKGAVGIITVNTPKDEKLRPFAQGTLFLHQRSEEVV